MIIYLRQPQRRLGFDVEFPVFYVEFSVCEDCSVWSRIERCLVAVAVVLGIDRAVSADKNAHRSG